ncbi:MAG: AraC family transcriptional regulator [Comamonas thiooxydans]
MIREVSVVRTQSIHGDSGVFSIFPAEMGGVRHEAESGAVGYFSLAPSSFAFRANVNYFLVFHNIQRGRALKLNSDQKHVSLTGVGGLELIPATSDFYGAWNAEKECVIVGIKTDRFKELCGLEYGDDHFELRQTSIGMVDRTALDLTRKMRKELESKDLGYKEYLNALVTTFSIHILRNYSSLSNNIIKDNGGGLSPTKWKVVEDYIAHNLSSNITLEKLSSLARLSPSHFSRAFKESTGLPPHQYIMQKRLTIAKSLLQRFDAPLSEIALMSGFSSNSHMTAMMRRSWGLTPSEVRKRLLS